MNSLWNDKAQFQTVDDSNSNKHIFSITSGEDYPISPQSLQSGDKIVNEAMKIDFMKQGNQPLTPTEKIIISIAITPDSDEKNASNIENSRNIPTLCNRQPPKYKTFHNPHIMKNNMLRYS